MKTWLITGASSGIGRHVAEQLLARGDRVAAVVRRPASLDDLAAAHGDLLRVVPFDVTDTAAMRWAVDETFAVLGRVDVVLSNAGYGLFGAAEEVTDAQIERVLATNLTGSIQFIRACLPHLRAQGSGRLIQTSSEGGQVAYPGFGLYHASKWGIEGFVETVALEVAPFGIAVTIVEPGPTDTSFRDNVDRADEFDAYRDGPAGEVRRAIESGAFELTGDAARTASAIIAAADAPQPPRRLVLGGAAYQHVEQALSDRLDSLRAQRDTAFAADKPG